MNPEKDYLAINKASWDKRTEAHLDSAFYDNKSFLTGRNSLNEIELAILGNVNGLKILHLQCHFGQDTISLSKMGAHVTGLDFSEKAITSAQQLATKMGTDTRFVHADVYNAPEVFNEKFDLIFTSYGTIGWLPDINAWGQVISLLLKPGGRFVFAEFHPVVWMYDDNLKDVQFNYFKDNAIIEDEEGTYANKNANIKTKCITWNHSLSSVFTALVDAGIEIKYFQEYDYSPYNCFANMVEFEPGKYRTEKFGNKIPLVYALHGVKQK